MTVAVDFVAALVGLRPPDAATKSRRPAFSKPRQRSTQNPRGPVQRSGASSFARHSSKNKSNAYMLEPSEDELAARARGDWDAAREAFKKTQDAFHDDSNRNKNASFYVDWLDGEFVAPSERITKEMLEKVTERNAEFLGYAQNSLRMLGTLTASPEVIRDLLSGFAVEAERLRAEEPDNLEEVMETMVSSILEAGKAKLAGRAH